MDGWMDGILSVLSCLLYSNNTEESKSLRLHLKSRI